MTEMASKGQGDAFALSHDSFAGLLPKLPGARVLSGHFQQTGISVAVPKGRPDALKIATGLIEDAKKSGLVRKALDAAGFGDADVAPRAADPWARRQLSCRIDRMVLLWRAFDV